jgi:hypothetical protein
MINYKLLAIQSLAPNAVVTILGDKVVWHSEDISQPSDTEILDETVRLEYLEEIKEYQRQRSSEYPPYADYLDGVVKGDQDQIDAYIAACQAVKNKYPKVEMDASVLAARKATALADYQAEEYIKATARLAQYQLSVGVPESSETIVTGEAWNEEAGEMQDVTETVVIPAIPALEATVEVTTYDMETDTSSTETVANPLIVKDDEERAAAQAVINATPGPVKAHVDS